MNTFLDWVAGFILQWLLEKAQAAVKDAADQVATDKERGEINAANIKAYEDAKNRAEARAAALDLINRNKHL